MIKKYFVSALIIFSYNVPAQAAQLGEHIFPFGRKVISALRPVAIPMCICAVAAANVRAASSSAKPIVYDLAVDSKAVGSYAKAPIVHESTATLGASKMIKTLTGDPTLVKSGFDSPPDDPLILIKQWLEAADDLKVKEPRGLVLSTVDAAGRPSSRVILIKEFDDTGLIFSTGSESAKGKDLKLNPWAAGTLWWRETMQQINMQGRVTMLSDEKSDAIFHERIRDAKAIAVISKQSAPLSDEELLKLEVLKLVQKEGEIERPLKWHAYHLEIESVEFWHGSKDRFHKRLRYDLDNGAWHHQRLQP